MLLLSRAKRSGGRGNFWKARVIDFIPCQQVPTTRKSRRTGSIKGTFFFFFDSGWKNSDLDEMYFKTVHFLFVNIGNYGSCWSIHNLTSYLSSRVSSLKREEKLLALSCTCGWHCSCPKNSFSCNYLLKHFTTRLSWRQDCSEMLWSTA